jgi:hypothetical protein
MNKTVKVNRKNIQPKTLEEVLENSKIDIEPALSLIFFSSVAP